MKILNFLKNHKTFVFVSVLILLIAAVYGKSLKYDYVYLDDDTLILENNDYISDYRNIPKLFALSVYHFSDED
ncbi:MAG: hypothetical protein LBR69_03405, partial [Endomicrobium sp.]|nr:hypothetical protein [Endomicrobium sp.]